MSIEWPVPLVLTDTADADSYRLRRDYSVTVDGVTYLAPEDMITDGASIPRFFWRLIGSPFTGRYRGPAVIHDAGYCGQLERSHGGPMTRAEVDSLFLRLMRSRGVARIKAWLIYRAVRLAGGKAWRAYHDGQ